MHRKYMAIVLLLLTARLSAGGRQCSSQGNAGELEQLSPDVAGEHRVLVTDNRLRKSVEAHNVVEERPGDGRRYEGVSEGG